MLKLLLNELKNKTIYIFLFFCIFLAFFLLTLLSKLLGESQATPIAFENWLIIVTFFITTYYYQKYNRKDFLNVSYLSGNKKNKIKIWLFIFIFFLCFVFAIIFFIMLYLLSYLNIIDENSITVSGIYFKLPNFSQLNFSFLFYSIIMYLLLMIGFAYLLNHFIEKQNFIYGIILVIFIINLRYSPVTISPLEIDFTSSFLIDRQNSYISGWTSIFSRFFIPWSGISIRFSKLFDSTVYLHFTNFANYYDLSHSELFYSLEYIPYLYILFIYFFPIFFKD